MREEREKQLGSDRNLDQTLPGVRTWLMYVRHGAALGQRRAMHIHTETTHGSQLQLDELAGSGGGQVAETGETVRRPEGLVCLYVSPHVLYGCTYVTMYVRATRSVQQSAPRASACCMRSSPRSSGDLYGDVVRARMVSTGEVQQGRA